MAKFEKSFRHASIKFIWEYDDIEHYIPVISAAIHKTYEWFKLDDKNIKDDIQAVYITDDGNDKVGFALYINNKNFRRLGSIYSIFKEQYKILARGYDDRMGIRFPPTKLDEFIDLFKTKDPLE